MTQTLKGITFSDDTYPLHFRYRNYRGEEAVRRARPIKLYFGSNQWHPEPQWLLEALDLDKDEIRIFAMRDMIEMLP